MVVDKLTKKILKKIIPPVVLKNLKGFSDAISSYYPNYLFGNGKINVLKHVYIEVTFKCNCRCQMCPLYGVQTEGGKDIIEYIQEENELTLQEYKELFHDLKELGTSSVNLTGGEPFLRRDILDIIKLAKDSDFKVSITSNGGLITKEIAKGVVERGVDNLTVSLDGPKEIHEGIRKAEIFDRVMQAIDWIAEEKKKQGKAFPSVDFLCTVSALNQNHLSGLVEIARNKSLPLTIDPIIFTSQESWNDTKEAFQEDFVKKESFLMPKNIGKIDTEALEKELERVCARARDLNQSVYVSIQGKLIRNKFFTDDKYSIVNKCFVPWYSCRIDPYGKVYPCSLSITMGNLRENSILEITNGENFVNFRKKLKKKRLFSFCSKCCFLYSHHIFWNYLLRL